MYKIIIKGEAETKYLNPEELNGIDCQDNFSEYFDDYYPRYKSIREKGLSGGYMDFRYEDNKLWTYTIYQSKEKLTEEELKSLQDYTTGQWSDGIGEGFEQTPCMEDNNGEEVYISPWFSGQKVEVFQEEYN